MSLHVLTASTDSPSERDCFGLNSPSSCGEVKCYQSWLRVLVGVNFAELQQSADPNAASSPSQHLFARDARPHHELC